LPVVAITILKLPEWRRGWQPGQFSVLWLPRRSAGS